MKKPAPHALGLTPANPGNGAREALIEFFRGTDLFTGEGDVRAADFALADLWKRGFKIVPLDPSDDR